MLPPVLAVWVATLALTVASLAVGAGLERASGWRAPTPLAPAIGFAGLLVLGGGFVLAAGHAATAATAILLAAALGLATVVAGGARAGRSGDRALLPGRDLAVPAAAGALVLLATSLPFAVSGRVGPLGAGNDNDLAVHLNTAASLAHSLPDAPSLIDSGYPLGPHGLAAALAQILGVSVTHAFLGVILAIPLIAAIAVCAALGDLRAWARIPVAALVALPYLTASFIGVGEFKEAGEAVLALAFALALRELRRAPQASWHVHLRSAIPLGVIAAGTLYVYSLPGLAWPAAVLGATGAVALMRALLQRAPAGRLPTRRVAEAFALRWLAPIPLAAIVLALVANADQGRLSRFTESSFASEPAHGLGNLVTPLSAWRGLGIWLRPDFRLGAQPALLNALLIALALLSALWGLRWWWRRGESAVIGGLLGCAAIYAAASQTQSPYASAKALAILAPSAMLVLAPPLVPLLVRAPGAARGTRLRRLLRRSGGVPARWTARGLALVVLGGAAVSTVLALRDAPVGPPDHARDLARLAALVGRAPTLFLGIDDFAGYELRGVSVARPPGLYPVWTVALRSDRLRTAGTAVDFLSVTALTLDRFRYAIAPLSAYDAGPPPNFQLVASTPSYVLWQRLGRTPVLETVGDGPGAKLDCRTPHGAAISSLQGIAQIADEPVIGRARAWSEGDPQAGDAARQTLSLGAGRWALSLQYVSRQSLRVRAAGLQRTLPPNLDRIGPHWLVGAVTLIAPANVTVTAEPEPFGLLGKLLGANGTVRALDGPGGQPLGVLTANRVDVAARTVPLSQACGSWVQWYAPAIAQRSQARRIAPANPSP